MQSYKEQGFRERNPDSTPLRHPPHASLLSASLSSDLSLPIACGEENGHLLTDTDSIFPEPRDKMAESLVLKEKSQGRELERKCQRLGTGLGVVTHACNPSTLGGQGGMIA